MQLKVLLLLKNNEVVESFVYQRFNVVNISQRMTEYHENFYKRTRGFSEAMLLDELRKCGYNTHIETISFNYEVSN